MKHKRNLDWLLDLPASWALLYTSLIAELEKLDPSVQVDQAKQKFGELRVYLARGSDEAYDLIEAATRASRATCQTCGEAARLRKSKGGFYSTLCDAHADGSEPTDDQPIVASFRLSGGSFIQWSGDKESLLKPAPPSPSLLSLVSAEMRTSRPS